MEVVNITFKDGCEYRFPEAELKNLLGVNVQDAVIYGWDDLSEGLFVYARGYEPMDSAILDDDWADDLEGLKKNCGKPCVCKNLGYWQLLTKEDLEQTHGGVLSVNYQGKVKLQRIAGVLTCTTALFAYADLYLSSRTENTMEMIAALTAQLESEYRLLLGDGSSGDSEKEIEEKVAETLGLPIQVIQSAKENSKRTKEITILVGGEASRFDDIDEAIMLLEGIRNEINCGIEELEDGFGDMDDWDE